MSPVSNLMWWVLRRLTPMEKLSFGSPGGVENSDLRNGRRPSPAMPVGLPGWCRAILRPLRAFSGQAGECWRGDDDYGDDGDYG
jgi:hypothetical protein